MGKSIWDAITTPITAPLNAAGGVIHGLGNALGNIPVVGGLAKYGGIATSDALHGLSDSANFNFTKAGNDVLSSASNAIHGPNTIPVVGKYILPAVAGFFGGPLGYGAATGIQNGFESARNGATFGDSAKFGATSGAISGAGSYAGGQLLGPTLNGLGSTVGSESGATTPGFMGTPIGQSLGEPALSSGGGALASTPGDVFASGAGATIGGSMAGPSPTAPVKPPAPWAPSRSGDMALPGSLSSYAGLSPQQQASNIATRGVYGQGNGPEENSYFTNLINRQLVDPSGNVTGDLSSINPVEGSYLNQIGLGGYNNPTDLLKKLQGYAA